MKEIIPEAKQFCANCENPLVGIFEITQPQGVHDARNLSHIIISYAALGFSPEKQKLIMLKKLNDLIEKDHNNSIKFFCETLELKLPQDFNS